MINVDIMNRQKEFSDKGRYTEIRKVTEGGGDIKVAKYLYTIAETPELVTPEFVEDPPGGEFGSVYILETTSMGVIGLYENTFPESLIDRNVAFIFASLSASETTTIVVFYDGDHGILPLQLVRIEQ